MSFETKIGWRYMYRSYGSPRAKIALIISLIVTAIGGGWMLVGGAGSGAAVLMLCLGALSSVICACLSLLSVFTTVAVLGVILSVATLTIVLAVTSGFQRVFQEKVLGVNAHVIITHKEFIDYEEEEKRIVSMHPDIVASQPFIYVEMMATRGLGEISGVALKGVRPEKVGKVLDLGKHLKEGEISSLRTSTEDGGLPTAIIGQGLSTKLEAKVGDEITVVAPFSGEELNNMARQLPKPKAQKFIVSGIFYSGFDEYDRRLVYVHLDELIPLWSDKDQVLGIELRVRDYTRASEVAKVIYDQLPMFDDQEPYRYGFEVQDWKQLNNTLFSALSFQRVIVIIILSLIVAVATFNLASSLFMVVTEKTAEISIMKAMGAMSSSVSFIFIFLGLCIGLLGTLLGVGLGVLIAYILSRYGYKLDPEVYLIDHLPVILQWTEIMVLGGVTIIVCMVATIIPSIRGARMLPAVGIREE